MSTISRLAQLALGAPFLVLGYHTATDPGPRLEAAQALGLPEPETAVRAGGAVMVLGGAALALNVLPRTAALGLAASLVPTTLGAHAFWKAGDGETRAAKQVQFVKNLGLLGGLIAFSASRSR